MTYKLIENRKQKFNLYEKKKKEFNNIVKVSKISSNFFLNKKGYNFNLINLFLKSKLDFSKKKNTSILDICISLDCMIPHYCYHFNLSIAGNCRMCLVEVSSSLKPIVACAVDLIPNQKISTETFLVKRARQGIMEFLLVNHPLDCPICDQGGECDLQDQSLIYGSDRGRFFHVSDLKRSVTELMCNNFVKLILTRCIHCTRCVRFLNEIGGDYTLGMLGRGGESEIGLYTDSLLISELGSNITDFCPVGALTIKTYALNKRSWEEIYLESIDLSDSLCVPIRIYSNGKKVHRILPQYNTDLDLSWITERTRFLSDGLITQQLDYPSIRVLSNFIKEDKITFKNIIAISWKSISYILLNRMKNNLNVICSYYTGEYLDLETLLYLKESALQLGSNNIINLSENNFNLSHELINEDFDSNYLLKIRDFNKYKNIFLINLNLRIENPILNAKLRQKYIWDTKLKIYFLGSKYNLTYKYIQIGISTRVFLQILEGRHYLFSFFKRSLDSNLILYNNELKDCYKTSFHRSLFNSFKELNKLTEINYLAKGASTLGSMDLSLNRYITRKKRLTNNLSNYSLNKKNNIYYFIGCNLLKQNKYTITKKELAHKLFIYQNSHGDNFFWFMDLFLPTYSYFENELGFYTNTFGILRKTRKVLFPRNSFIQHDKEILKLVQKMIYNNTLKRSKMTQDQITLLCSYMPIYLFVQRRYGLYNILESKKNNVSLYSFLYSSKKKNFYKNDLISMYSANLNMISHTYFLRKSNLTL